MKVKIKYLRKKNLLFLPLLFYGSLYSQVPQINYNAGTFSKEKLKELNAEYGVNKQIPGVYTEQILIALSFFPEFKSTKIIFLIKRARSPLETRPSWSSVFKPSTYRTYIVTINDSSMSILSPILFKHLPFNAQVVLSVTS